jgi:outer membrane immunogenic protein
MKKKLLLSVAFFGAAVAANSSALAAPPMYSWTGCYIGANAGYSWGRAWVDSSVPGLAALGAPSAFSTSLNPNGFIGGGQVGCNWQNGNAVWGLETDFQGSAQKDSQSSSLPFNDGEGTATLSQQIDVKLRWFGTARARAGVLVVPTILLYGTGGLAYGNVSLTDTISIISANLGNSTTTFSQSTTRAGWTLGFGFEGMFPNAPRWTWKVEYLHLDLGSFNGSAIDPVAGLVAWSTHFTDDIVRAGINVKFTP